MLVLVKKGSPHMDQLDKPLIAELCINARAAISPLGALLALARRRLTNRRDRLIALRGGEGPRNALAGSQTDDLIRAIVMI